MQRNKRLMKTRKARQRKQQSTKLRKQKEMGQASGRKSRKSLLNVARCMAVLKSGKRCSRTAEKKIKGEWYCWQHRKGR